MNIFYVYVSFRPWDGSPCYVGKGKGNRWRIHSRKSHNRRLQSIINKAGGEIPIVIIRSGISETEAFEIEVALIKAIGRNRNGPLVNMTDGGEGISGFKHSAEAVEKLRERSKGNKYGVGVVHVMSEEDRARRSARLKGKGFFTGQKHSAETKEHLSKVRSGRKLTAEHCEAIGLSKRGKPLDLQWCTNISIAKKGMKFTDEHRKNLSLAHLGKPSGAKGRKHTPEALAKISASSKGRFQSEETKAKRSTSMSLFYEKQGKKKCA